MAGALKQLKDTETWRETNKLDELYDTFDVDAFEEARKVVSSPHMPGTTSK